MNARVNSDKQYVNSEPCKVTIHVMEKRKKKKEENMKLKTQQSSPSKHSIGIAQISEIYLKMNKLLILLLFFFESYEEAS